MRELQVKTISRSETSLAITENQGGGYELRLSASGEILYECEISNEKEAHEIFNLILKFLDVVLPSNQVFSSRVTR